MGTQEDYEYSPQLLPRIPSFQSPSNTSTAGDYEKDEEAVRAKREKRSLSNFCRRISSGRNSAERNPVERTQISQDLQAWLHSSSAGEDEEDVGVEREESSSSPYRDDSSEAEEDEELEADVRMEREETPISPFTFRGIPSSKNPAECIQSLQSSLNSAFDEYCKQFKDMQTDLARGEIHNKELSERNKKLTTDLRQAKRQSSKKLQDMEAELGKVKVVNRDLDKRNKKLQEKLHKARGQYWKKFLDIKTELVTAKSKIEEYYKINNELGGRLDVVEPEYSALIERNKKLEEELNMAKERENSIKRNFEQTRNKMQELCTTFTAVTEECDQACKPQEPAEAARYLSKKRKYVLKVYEVNDWVNCSICMEPWTESGEHNACSLSCGHFFGRSCITQWISRNGSRGSSTCPVCSNRTTLSDIRRHYVSQIHDGKEKFEQAE